MKKISIAILAALLAVSVMGSCRKDDGKPAESSGRHEEHGGDNDLPCDIGTVSHRPGINRACVNCSRNIGTGNDRASGDRAEGRPG